MPAFLLVLALPTIVFAEPESTSLQSTHDEEKEEIVYFSLEENPEVVKEEFQMHFGKIL